VRTARVEKLRPLQSARNRWSRRRGTVLFNHFARTAPGSMSSSVYPVTCRPRDKASTDDGAGSGPTASDRFAPGQHAMRPGERQRPRPDAEIDGAEVSSHPLLRGSYSRKRQNALGNPASLRMPFAVCRDRSLTGTITCCWMVPHVMVALAMAFERPAGLFELFSDGLAKPLHAAIFTRPGAMNSNETSRAPLPSSKSSIAPGSLS
jgi:hypothetical protein